LIDYDLYFFIHLLLIFYFIYLKKNCGKKQNSNAAVQPLALSLLDMLID